MAWESLALELEIIACRGTANTSGESLSFCLLRVFRCFHFYVFVLLVLSVVSPFLLFNLFFVFT